MPNRRSPRLIAKANAIQVGNSTLGEASASDSKRGRTSRSKEGKSCTSPVLVSRLKETKKTYSRKRTTSALKEDSIPNLGRAVIFQSSEANTSDSRRNDTPPKEQKASVSKQIGISGSKETNVSNPILIGTSGSKGDGITGSRKQTKNPSNKNPGDNLIPRTSPTTRSLLINLPEIEVTTRPIDKDTLIQYVECCDEPIDANAYIARFDDIIPQLNYIVSCCMEGVLRSCDICSVKLLCQHKVTSGFKILYLCTDSCLECFKNMVGDIGIFFHSPPLKIKPSLNQLMWNVFFKGKECGQCSKVVGCEDLNLSWELMEFCNDVCLSQFQHTIGSVCAYCHNSVQYSTVGKYCVRFGNCLKSFCSAKCLEVCTKRIKLCAFCQKDITNEKRMLAQMGDNLFPKEFCSILCLEKYDAAINSRVYALEPLINCSVCNSNNPILAEYVGPYGTVPFCGEYCFMAYKHINKIVSGMCPLCRKYYDAKVLDQRMAFVNQKFLKFCSEDCLNSYIVLQRKVIKCSCCSSPKFNCDMILKKASDGTMLMLCSMTCVGLYSFSSDDLRVRRYAYRLFYITVSKSYSYW